MNDSFWVRNIGGLLLVILIRAKPYFHVSSDNPLSHRLAVIRLWAIASLGITDLHVTVQKLFI